MGIKLLYPLIGALTLALGVFNSWHVALDHGSGVHGHSDAAKAVSGAHTHDGHHHHHHHSHEESFDRAGTVAPQTDEREKPEDDHDHSLQDHLVYAYGSSAKTQVVALAVTGIAPSVDTVLVSERANPTREAPPPPSHLFLLAPGLRAPPALS